MNSKTDEKRGGSRPNSGRKAPLGTRQTLNCRVLPLSLQRIKALAVEQGISVGELIDRLILTQ